MGWDGHKKHLLRIVPSCIYQVSMSHHVVSVVAVLTMYKLTYLLLRQGEIVDLSLAYPLSDFLQVLVHIQDLHPSI